MQDKRRPWQTLSREKTGDTQSERQSKRMGEITRERKKETEGGRSHGMQVKSQPERESWREGRGPGTDRREERVKQDIEEK